MSPQPIVEQPPLINERFRGYLPVVIDIETGGFNPQSDAILEIGATTLEMDESGFLNVKDTLDFAVLPFSGANLDPDALKFTGIEPFNPERGARDEGDVLDELFKHIKKEMKIYACKRAILVGHNAAFDHNFLTAAIERTDNKRNPFHPFSMLDTVSLSALAFGQTVLAKSCMIAGIDFNHQDAHSAAYDALKTAELFCIIHNQWLSMGAWPPAHNNYL